MQTEAPKVWGKHYRSSKPTPERKNKENLNWNINKHEQPANIAETDRTAKQEEKVKAEKA